MTKKELIQGLDNNPDLRSHLFIRGFLITTQKDINTESFPFYGQWRKEQYGQFDFLLHPLTKLFCLHKGNDVFFLIGHAFNPFSMEISEEVILEHIAGRYGTEAYQQYIDQLTGIFIFGVIRNNAIEFQCDASGMQYCCYGTVKGKHYIASHMQLIGDICRLEQSEYVKRLTNYKWYHYMMGNYMPGNITCFDEVKRIIPNTAVYLKEDQFTIDRFYPCHSIEMADTETEYQQVIEKGAEILRNTMAIIPQKWNRPAISLTGGIDSNTTFAAANGNYDRYSTFSYISMPREAVDAEKAKEISDRFNVPFKAYHVPEQNEDCPDFELYKAIFIHNDGEIGRAKDNDTRKKITLINSDVCDVEVKSWISETIRAYAYKYFGREQYPQKPTPRIFTSLYKIFLGNRKLAVQTDEYFRKYFEETKLLGHLYNYDYTDFFVWEMMHGGKCALNIGVMKSCFDITIPYNNRALLDLLLRVPLEKRISDQHHMDLKRKMNQELYDMNIRVVNLNETKTRKKAINLYYIINTHIPF